MQENTIQNSASTSDMDEYIKKQYCKSATSLVAIKQKSKHFKFILSISFDICRLRDIHFLSVWNLVSDLLQAQQRLCPDSCLLHDRSGRNLLPARVQCWRSESFTPDCRHKPSQCFQTPRAQQKNNYEQTHSDSIKTGSLPTALKSDGMDISAGTVTGFCENEMRSTGVVLFSALNFL